MHFVKERGEREKGVRSVDRKCVTTGRKGSAEASGPALSGSKQQQHY